MEVGHNHTARQLVQVVWERPELRWVPHLGYGSLFPFMAWIIPSGSWILEKQVQLISKRSLLWSMDYVLLPKQALQPMLQCIFNEFFMSKFIARETQESDALY